MGSVIGIVFAMVIFQLIAPYIFEASESINIIRVIVAGIFGVLGAVLGDRIYKKIKSEE